MKITNAMLDELIKAMYNTLKKCNSGMVTLEFGDTTFIITDKPEGAKAMLDAWRDWSDEE